MFKSWLHLLKMCAPPENTNDWNLEIWVPFFGEKGHLFGPPQKKHGKMKGSFRRSIYGS